MTLDYHEIHQPFSIRSAKMTAKLYDLIHTLKTEQDNEYVSRFPQE